jgi:hypothetical protein
MNITKIPFIDFIEQVKEFYGGFKMRLLVDALRASKITFGMWWDEEFTKHPKHLETYVKQLGLQNHDIVILDEAYNVEEIVADGLLPILHMIIDVENIGQLYCLVSRLFNLRAFL